MYIANDKNGERVHIESAKKGVGLLFALFAILLLFSRLVQSKHITMHTLKASYALILGSTIHRTGDLIILIALGKNIKKE